MPWNKIPRISETVTMIENAAGLTDLTPNICADIGRLINEQYNRLSNENKKDFSDLSADMSVKNKIAPGTEKGHKPERQKRRAIYLLWMVLGKKQNGALAMKQKAESAMRIAPGELNEAFSDVMLKAAVVASAAGAQHVFNKLTLHPRRFIGEHRIIVLGLPAGGDRFSTAPNGDYRNVLEFYFQYNALRDRFELGGVPNAVLGGLHPFDTVSVPAVHWTTVPGAGPSPCNFAGILGCELTGADVMVTTQFTGCAFNWTQHGGVLRASHVSPAGGGPGTYPGGGIALAQRVMANGTHANAGNTPVTVFGGGAGNALVAEGNPFYPNTVANPIRWVTIFGVDKGGEWRFYTQVIDGNKQIIEARRIL